MNNEWIKELKVGDEVFVRGRYLTLGKVQRITPTGRIVIDGVQFASDGRGRTSDKWAIRMLEQATTEKIIRYKKAIFISAVRAAMRNLDNISYSAAKQINEILNLGVVDTSEDKQ